MPRVFISYSQESEAHKARVLALAQALRGNGMDVELDQFHSERIVDWPRWCRAQLKNADFVLCICTSEYRARVEGDVPADRGQGVHWEGALLDDEFYAGKGNDRVIPILLDTAPESGIPDFMRGWTRCRLTTFDLAEAGYQQLYRILTGQPSVVPAPLGPIVELPPHAPASAAAPTPVAAVASVPSATNPFDPWTPAVPPRFVGRAGLLRDLAHALDEGRSVSLVGDWRIGKSSLLQTWARQALAKGRTSHVLSGEGPEAMDCARFVQTLTGAPPAQNEPDVAADALDAWLRREPLPPLVLLDEADSVFCRLPYRFFERLRGMLGRLCLVFATRREIDDLYRAAKSTSPFLNRVQLLRIGLLEPATVETLIGYGAGVLAAGDVALMRRWAGRHPYFLVLLGHYLWEARCDGSDGTEALDRFQVEAFQRLHDLWQVLAEREQQALRSLLNDRIVSMASLRQRGLIDDGRAFGEVLTAWMAEQT